MTKEVRTYNLYSICFKENVVQDVSARAGNLLQYATHPPQVAENLLQYATHPPQIAGDLLQYATHSPQIAGDLLQYATHSPQIVGDLLHTATVPRKSRETCCSMQPFRCDLFTFS
jgi:hypothetical protein